MSRFWKEISIFLGILYIIVLANVLGGCPLNAISFSFSMSVKYVWDMTCTKFCIL